MGASCDMAAFGTADPFVCTSQHRIWLSHEPAATKLEAGLQAMHEMPSVAAFGTSTSVLAVGAWA
jgi:hypothetical protein